MLVKLLNLLSEIAQLPKGFLPAVIWLLFTAVMGAFILGRMDIVQASIQLDGFWKVKVAAWVIYLLVIGFMGWRICANWIYFNWNDWRFYIDEPEHY